ncbi:MAG: Ig-like domain-containing protein [Oscillospiraceae bacterium]|nr:Ig-like domain-containing protein [Oscillospiraceae bacterium]
MSLKRIISVLTVFALTAGLLPLYRPPAARAAEEAGAVQIVMGEEHTVALMDDGSVWAWGRNQHGQLGDGTTYTRLMPVKINMFSDSPVESLIAGANHTLAVLQDGTLLAWGNNKNGQLGNGTTKNSLRPAPVLMDGSEFKVSVGGGAVSAGFCHTAAINEDGRLYAWGLNSYGQLGTGDNKNRISPVLVKFEPDIYDEDEKIWEEQDQPDTSFVACGYNHTLANVGGTVYSFGCNMSGQLGIGDLVNRNTPQEVEGVSGTELRCGNAHSMVVEGGTLYGWGSNAFGQIDPAVDNPNIVEPVEMKMPEGINVQDAQGGYYHSVILLADDTVFALGFNSRGQLGNGAAELHSTGHLVKISDPEAPPPGYDEDDFFEDDFEEDDEEADMIPLEADIVASGYYFSGVIDKNGNLWLWGDNGFGQLGDATQTRRSRPIPLPAKIFYEEGLKPVNQVMFIGENNKSVTKLTVGLGKVNGMPLTARIMPAEVPYETLTWTVSNSDVVKLVRLKSDDEEESKYPEETVWVCGNKKAGTAIVTATAYNGKSVSCRITVRPTADMINITAKPTRMIEVGASYRMKAEVLLPSSYDKGVVWSLVDDVDDEDALAEYPFDYLEDPDFDGVISNDVAQIDQNGLLRANAKGTAHVRAQSVMDPAVYTVVSVACGYFATGTNIYDEEYDGSQTPLKNVTLYIDRRDSKNPVYGETQLYAVNFPFYDDDDDDASQAIKWSVTPESVCIIDEDGLLRAVRPGKATVTARTTDGSNRYAKIEVNIVSIGTEIELLSPAAKYEADGEYSVTVGAAGRVNFKGRVQPVSAAQNIVWTIENEEPESGSGIVGMINEKGAFTGLNAGTCDVVGRCADLPSGAAEIVIHVSVIIPVTKLAVVLKDDDRIISDRVFIVDDEFVCEAMYTPYNATVQEVVWSSSNTNALVVDPETGEATAIGPGKTRLTATAADGSNKKSSVTVSVMSKPDRIFFGGAAEYTLEAGKSLSLKATVYPLAAPQTLIWEITDDSDAAATISEKGVVKAFGEGTVYVIARSAFDPDVEMEEPVVINCVMPVKSFSLTPKSAVVVQGGTLELDILINPYDATDPFITMAKLNVPITVDTYDHDSGVEAVEFDEDEMTITVEIGDDVRPGTYTLTFKCGGKTAAVKLTVKPPPDEIELNTSKISRPDEDDEDLLVVWKGKSVSVSAKVLPLNADQKVTWHTEPEVQDIVSIDSNGNIRGLNPGEVTVFCRTIPDANDDYIESEPIELRCEVPVTSIKASTSKTIEMTVGGDPEEVEITVLPFDAYGAGDWTFTTRRDDDVVSVDKDDRYGESLIIEAVGAGSDTITVTAGGKSVMINVRVYEAPASVEITTREMDTFLLKGKTIQLKAVVEPRTAKQIIYWESEDPGIAKVGKTGAVTVAGQGDTVIRAYTLDSEGREIYSADYEITTMLPMTGLKISPNSITVYPGDVLGAGDIDIEIRPFDEAYQGRNPRWRVTSSDRNVAKVDAFDPDTGDFTITAGDKRGSCAITITYGDGTVGVKSAKFTVKNNGGP